MRRKFIKTLWLMLGWGFVLFICFGIAIWNGWIGNMPDFDNMQNPIDKYASQVYSADSVLIGTYNLNKDNRLNIPYDSISPHVVHALIATEDERFYEHSGIDYIALGRAILKRGLLGQESAGGGSTITQQLAKQLYSEQANSKLERLFQKPVEWAIAIKLERYYTKEEILTMYLNKFDFLHNAVGIKMAARTYFSKEPKDLTVTESATLVGLCKNPSLFNPVRYKERSIERRNVVLGQMVKSGYLSQAEYATYSSEDMNLHFHVADHVEGAAPYFREYLRQYMMANEPRREDYPSYANTQFYVAQQLWKNDPLYGWCNKNKKSDGTPYNIYTDGLKIYTTIDTRMQKYAEDSMREHVGGYLQKVFNQARSYNHNFPFDQRASKQRIESIMNSSMRQSVRWNTMNSQGYSDEEIRASFDKKTEMTIYSYGGEIDTMMTPRDSILYYKHFLRSGFVSMEPQTGHIKAYVGGLDFRYFKYDMAMSGRRQVGSTMKPLLYGYAMDNGHNPCELVPNVMKTYYYKGRPFCPKNGSRARYGSNVPIRWGLQTSNNWVTAYLMSVLDPEVFVEYLKAYGIDTPDIQPVQPLCLGSCEVTVGEMASAYTTFVNHGVRCAPIMVTRIEDSNGNVLATFEPRQNQVLSEDASYKMLDMLQAVYQGGTAHRLRDSYGVNCQLGAKTGTTNDNSDAWFMAVTPQLVSACWVGGENRDIHFTSTSIGQGAAAALPVFAYYIRQLFRDPTLPYKPDAKFEIPDGYDPCDGGEGGDTFSEQEEVYM